MLKKNILIGCVCFSSLLFSSCGTGKKLEAANTQIGQLKSQVAQLTDANSALQHTNDDQKNQLAAISERDRALAESLQHYEAQCTESQRKLQAVQQILNEQYAALMDMKAKIIVALADFNDKGVDVYYKDGLVYVDMQENLLYNSGSAMLGEKGKKALSSLADVLNSYPHLQVTVLGNTDDVKFKKGFDNWSLSTERANGIVRILRDNYLVDPARMMSAGKGKYNPVADNTTPEGRARNRRTEIILQPDMERLWESVQK